MHFVTYLIFIHVNFWFFSISNRRCFDLINKNILLFIVHHSSLRWVATNSRHMWFKLIHNRRAIFSLKKYFSICRLKFCFTFHINWSQMNAVVLLENRWSIAIRNERQRLRQNENNHQIQSIIYRIEIFTTLVIARKWSIVVFFLHKLSLSLRFANERNIVLFRSWRCEREIERHKNKKENVIAREKQQIDID